MGFVNGNLAKEAGRLHGWRERFWGRRYTAIVVSHEEAAQVTRLRYILEQGTKEGLVRSPLDWPGTHSTQALLDGRPIRGIWFDRTREYEARRCGQRPEPRNGWNLWRGTESYRRAPKRVEPLAGTSSGTSSGGGLVVG